MPIENSYFLNDKGYYEQDFASVFSQIYGGNGVSNKDGTEGGFKLDALANMQLQLSPGFAVANGYQYELAEAVLLDFEAADPLLDRFDRVVIRFNLDPNVREFKAVVKRGNAAAAPVAPALTRDSYIYELSVARVLIPAGRSYLEQSNVYDERANKDVCGYIPLHNLLRGVIVDENGVVTMPNQSFVKSDGVINLPLSSDADHFLAVQNVLSDTQSEISEGYFVPKSDGTYHFWLEVAVPSNHFAIGTVLEAYIMVNGVDRLPLFSHVVANTKQAYFIGSGVDLLKKGDEVYFRIRTRAAGTGKALNFMKSTISKIG